MWWCILLGNESSVFLGETDREIAGRLRCSSWSLVMRDGMHEGCVSLGRVE